MRRKMTRNRLIEIGARLAAARKAKGMSKTALGDRAGVDRLTVGRIELGQREGITLDTLERLAEALGIQVHELLEPLTQSNIEPIVKSYLRSPWAQIDKIDSADHPDIKWLRSLGSAFWSGVPPTDETVHDAIQMHRKTHH